MNKILTLLALTASVAACAAGQCKHEAAAPAATAPATGAPAHDHAAMGPTTALAAIEPTTGSTVKGTVRFETQDDKLKVIADLQGLTPGALHAFHVHQFGDCSSGDGKSAGDHYNPQGHQHGLPSQAARHAGDLGNLQADAQGKVHHEIVIENASIFGANAILGRAVIVHAKTDDGGQPTGNAGPRAGCGVIGAAK